MNKAEKFIQKLIDENKYAGSEILRILNKKFPKKIPPEYENYMIKKGLIYGKNW